LISTNTIGQGVNFPIKTIIIHSLSIDQRHNIKIRDFWNVVGRAGRAGKETEGQIIFLTFNDNDVHLYRRYTNKSNIESSYSLLFLILSLIQNRISGDNHDNLEILLENLIEPNLLDLLLEESVDTSDEELIREILGYSLFMIQSMDADYDIEPIVQGISKIKQKFCSIDKELRKVYSKTGLPISSCNKIYEYIQNNIAELREITIKDDYQSLFEQIINILLEIPEMNETRAKINKEVLTKNHKELTSFVIHWMDGSNINELKELWANYFTDNPLENAMYDYINKLLEYRYPWGVTIFLLILVFILNKNYSDAPIKYDDLPGNIKNLSSYIKYGLNTPSACAAKSLGVNTRETSLKISDYVGNVQLKEFINILKNLDSEDIEILNLSNFESENILYLIQKLNFGKITFEELKSLEFEVKGINYSDERIQLASKIEIGDILELKRDPNNIYDVYAVKIVYEDMELGFIPRNISKILAVEMDLNKRSFQALIINKEDEYRLKFGIID
jgi:Superfamily II helicase